MNKAIFLDRDGTLNVDKGYIKTFDDFELIDGVIEALKVLIDKGYILIIITNQSGVARGFFSEYELSILHGKMLDLFESHHINIKDIFYCPHLLGSLIDKYNLDCQCRKPHTALVEKAIEKYNISRSESYFIGDKYSDIECGFNAGIKNLVLLSSDSQKFRLDYYEYSSLIDFINKHNI